MESIPVLYDGWPLLHHPDGPASTHLYTLLQALPPGVAPLLALPGPTPDWLESFPQLTVLSEPGAGSGRARWRWEQLTLPRLARRAGARLIHLTHRHPALLAGLPVVVSPTAPPSAERADRQLAGRIRQAAAQGGMARLAGLFWPEDLPSPAGWPRLFSLPPRPLPNLDTSEPPLPPTDGIPEPFLLTHGPLSPTGVTRLLDAWSWAAGAIGELYPLVILGAGRASAEVLKERLPQYGMGDTILLREARHPGQVVAFYHRSTAVFHPAAAGPWGSPVRNALFAGKPLVTTTDPLNDALVGSAAFTVPATDPRKLGAALITTVVEEEVAVRLATAARQRSAAWTGEGFGEKLLAAYQGALHR